jgi:cell division septum initiation protein DivIVA
MPAAAFDTLRLARRLQGLGLPPGQADGFAEAFADTMVIELATKSDLAGAEARLRSEMADMRSESRLECERLRTDIAASRADIIRWVVPLILAQMALTVGVLLRVSG